jgi:ribonuclease HI
MLKVKEADEYYAAFDECFKGPISVYVDGSFRTDNKDMTRPVSMASGWAICDGNANLLGYGVTAFNTETVYSSQISELKALLAFLDTMQDSFPGIINRDFPITVIGDNLHLMKHLSMALVSEESSRYCFERNGEDYLRLLYYLSVMDLKFEWVKGHHGNDFNHLADLLAKKAYQSISTTGFFPTDVRNDFIESLLRKFNRGEIPFKPKSSFMTHKQLRKSITKNGPEVLVDIPTIWVGMQRIEHKGRTFAGFSFTDTKMEVKGSRGAVLDSSYSDLHLTMRAINEALSSYAKKAAGPALVIRTDNELASSLVNTFRNGHKWDNFLADPALRREVDKLRIFSEKQHVLALEVSDGYHAYKELPGMVQSLSWVADSAQETASCLRKAHQEASE